ncbi:helix-turn-helix domain-containing protein [Flavitalea sp.]|nr:AraC family transcriptional regulator [Flavitalea sp.]
MLDLYGNLVANTNHYKQLRCADCLVSIYNCPLENKNQDIWSQHNYFVYVMKGRKIWHTTHGSYNLSEGSCVLVRKGACIVEQFFDDTFCLVIFFVTDEFICEVLQTKTSPVKAAPRRYQSVIAVETNAVLRTFFESMMPFFEANPTPDRSLINLKFRELILTVADNPANEEMLCYFCSLLNTPRSVSLQEVMEDNFCFNLKLEEFAKLSSRSLSAFKRDFIKIYKSPPGKWLLEKRLNHALHLITNRNKTIGETVFESGFESPSHFSRVFRDRFGRSPASLKTSETFEV